MGHNSYPRAISSPQGAWALTHSLKTQFPKPQVSANVFVYFGRWDCGQPACNKGAKSFACVLRQWSASYMEQWIKRKAKIQVLPAVQFTASSQFPKRKRHTVGCSSAQDCVPIALAARFSKPFFGENETGMGHNSAPQKAFISAKRHWRIDAISSQRHCLRLIHSSWEVAPCLLKFRCDVKLTEHTFKRKWFWLLSGRLRHTWLSHRFASRFCKYRCARVAWCQLFQKSSALFRARL